MTENKNSHSFAEILRTADKEVEERLDELINLISECIQQWHETFDFSFLSSVQINDLKHASFLNEEEEEKESDNINLHSLVSELEQRSQEDEDFRSELKELHEKLCQEKNTCEQEKNRRLIAEYLIHHSTIIHNKWFRKLSKLWNQFETILIKEESEKEPNNKSREEKRSQHDDHDHLEQPEKIRILSMDGGGIRGIALVEMLMQIERVQGKKIHELFDLICGTSTGGLIALAVGAGKIDLEELKGLYLDFGVDVFSHPESSSFQGLPTPSWYDTTVLTDGVKKIVGDRSLVAQEDTPRVFVVSTTISQGFEPVLFKNYRGGSHSKYRGIYGRPGWHAARATSAAPPYFMPFMPHYEKGPEIYFDGGTTCNNPTLIAISEARQIWSSSFSSNNNNNNSTNNNNNNYNNNTTTTPPIHVVSLGTGSFEMDLSTRFVDRFHFARIPYWRRGAHEIQTWMQLVQQIVSTATSSEPTVQLMDDLAPDLVSSYIRLDPRYEKDITMDTTDPEEIEYVVETTRRYIERHVNAENPLFPIDDEEFQVFDFGEQEIDHDYFNSKDHNNQNNQNNHNSNNKINEENNEKQRKSSWWFKWW